MNERYEIYAAFGPDARADTVREAAEKALWLLSELCCARVPFVFLRDAVTGTLIALDPDSIHCFCGPVPEPQSRKVDP